MALSLLGLNEREHIERLVRNLARNIVIAINIIIIITCAYYNVSGSFSHNPFVCFRPADQSWGPACISSKYWEEFSSLGSLLLSST